MTNQQPCKDMNRLHAAITDMDCLSQQAFSEIEVTAELLLRRMESPEFYKNMDILAGALILITTRAQQALESVGHEADSVGCGYIDSDRLRRQEALKAHLSGEGGG
ncbi:hypothetical protein [Serratia fonticola]|uniref:hypothetical protein n=1 Tax=Serratia fonticola TaxID=47917 RepID=UPI000E0EFE3B|nr:hypothetical protein [Serratia fonticola]RDL25080.1 hypothetical protein DFO62_10612 [Serratia fonticola]